MSSARMAARLLTLALLAEPGVARADGFIHGANYASIGGDHFSTAESDRSLARLRSDGVDMISIAAAQPMDPATDAISATRNLPTPNGPIGPNPYMAHAVATAHRLGMKVAVKISVIDGAGRTMQSLNYDPHDWATFWRGYRGLVLDYARFAAAQHVELLFIGTELGGRITGPAHRQDWLDLIAEVRKAYSGKLAYAATSDPVTPDCYVRFNACWWAPNNDEAHWLSFWPALDYAGVNVYPHFTAKDPATLDREMAEQARFWRASVAATGRPGLVSEIGTPSMKDAERNTSGWQAAPDVASDLPLQAALYRAMIGYYVAHGEADGFRGVFVWLANTHDYTGKGDPNGFLFTGKPAEAVLKGLYGGR